MAYYCWQPSITVCNVQSISPTYLLLTRAAKNKESKIHRSSYATHEKWAFIYSRLHSKSGNRHDFGELANERRLPLRMDQSAWRCRVSEIGRLWMGPSGTEGESSDSLFWERSLTRQSAKQAKRAADDILNARLRETSLIRPKHYNIKRYIIHAADRREWRIGWAGKRRRASLHWTAEKFENLFAGRNGEGILTDWPYGVHTHRVHGTCGTFLVSPRPPRSINQNRIRVNYRFCSRLLPLSGSVERNLCSQGTINSVWGNSFDGHHRWMAPSAAFKTHQILMASHFGRFK